MTMTTMMRTTVSTLRVRNLRRMLGASTKHLTNAEADAAVTPVECTRMSEASADCLANAKANAADVPV